MQLIDNNESIHMQKTLYSKYFKGLLDLMVALVATVILIPIFMIIGIAIKVDSKGPILFKQPRIGMNRKIFYIYKFRTMHTTAPSQGRSPTSKDDPRITRVGKILRKTSLDELPQVFNIVKGQMSFIGPRPEQQIIVEQFYTEYENQRFYVKPGITGLWQISLDRTKPIHENLQYDFYYISNMNFLLDVKVLVKTVQVMLRSNTY
ncbi:UDP-N-acetylgalactosamine-undecaprenyl-phosphate N-acetylgalactosaminephosphotransferase [Bacillus mobilis]|uniref:UDP-N-acetylgalactosamine-undecaprenyl-phosphate N-acetylgalactosaminephosphotransferase n=1 Tax=Bacillus mobilis TaxID=2026190 RepID=A0A1Y5YYK7_9BACI|nr:sugar transferase [Bacillus mobilis]SMD72677.1 UDP-N-acetylgalactosamine-undecaprenyl-phosphate N-acetylgalactosaminephosphotransferase [Bacillus mobilis]